MNKIFRITSLLWIFINLSAQYEDIKFNNISSDLSDNNVRAIIKDSLGYMWFGTPSGLNRYDGNKFYVYENIFDDTTSLSHNSVRSLYLDPDGNLWVSTASGLNLFNIEKNNFIQYKYAIGKSKSSRYNIVSQVAMDVDKTLWITTEGGLCYLKKGEKNYKAFEANISGDNNKLLRPVRSIYIDHSQGKILIGDSYQSYIYVADKKNNSYKVWDYLGKRSNSIRNAGITNIFLTSDSSIWITTLGNGAYEFSNLDNNNTSVHHYYHNQDSDKGLSHNRIISICEMPTGKIWLGTENGGLNLYDSEKQKNTVFKNLPNENNSLSSNSIWSLFNDGEQRLWIGTFHTGIDIIDWHLEKFKSYKSSKINPNTLSFYSVTAFTEDTLGNLYIATDGGGINYFEPVKKKFTHYKQIEGANSISSNAALCFLWGDNHTLYIGTWEGGVNVFNTITKSFSYISTEDGLSINNVFSMAKDNDGLIYFGTYARGLDVYNPETKEFDNYSHSNTDSNSLCNNAIYVLYFDRKQNLWIGTENGGLSKMTRNNSGEVTFKNFIHNPLYDKGLSDNTILAIHEDSKGNMWFGTRDGLNKYEIGSENFSVYRKRDGLPHNTVVGILEDEKGILWLSTLNGLSKFNPDSSTFTIFDKSDGLQGDKFSIRSAYFKSRDGRMYFGGNDGFTTFHPMKLKYNKRIPDVYLSELKIFNKTVRPGQKNSPLKKHISVTEHLILNYDQTVFTLEFVALNYTHPENNQYAYKLEGFEDEWNYVGTKKTATYTNLDPGSYTFRVIASNNDRVWNEDGLSLPITIEPPFWGTWWFRILSIGIGGLLIILFVLNRIKSIEEKNLKLEKLVRKRTKQLEETNTKLLIQSKELQHQRDQLVETNAVKDKLFSVIAHDLKSPFNGLLGFIKILKLKYDKQTDDKRKSMIDRIYTSSNQIFNLLQSLLDWSRAQQGKITPVIEDHDMVKLAINCIEFEKSKARAKDIDIILSNPSIPIYAKFDKDLIETVLRNLISNAIKFTAEKGVVTVSCTILDKQLFVSVKDTGIGIEKEDINKLFKSSTHFTTEGTDNEQGTGIGLIMCKDFIDLHNGKLWVESKPGKGSEFYITIPQT